MAILHQEQSHGDREGRIAQLHQEKRTDELFLTEWGDPHEGVDESGVARGLESSIAVYPAVAEVMPLREGPPRKHLESEVESRGHAHHYGGELESPSEPEGGYSRASHKGARVSGEDPGGIPVELQEAQIGDHEERAEESEFDLPLPPGQEGEGPDRDRRVARLQPVEPRQHVAEVRRSGDREGDDEERVERTEGDETKEGRERSVLPARETTSGSDVNATRKGLYLCFRPEMSSATPSSPTRAIVANAVSASPESRFPKSRSGTDASATPDSMASPPISAMTGLDGLWTSIPLIPNFENFRENKEPRMYEVAALDGAARRRRGRFSASHPYPE